MLRHQAVFISASIPDPSALEPGLPPVDATAVRDALIACIDTILAQTDYHIIWGGHPAITSLISYILRSELNINIAAETLSETALSIKKRFHLYQSTYYTAEERPESNRLFDTVFVERKVSRADSLRLMRETMLCNEAYDIVLGIFLGGRQEGLREEVNFLIQMHPEALVFPVGSTGGYSAILNNPELASWHSHLSIPPYMAEHLHFRSIFQNQHSKFDYYNLFNLLIR